MQGKVKNRFLQVKKCKILKNLFLQMTNIFIFVDLDEIRSSISAKDPFPSFKPWWTP